MWGKKRIYLDTAAATPVDKRVRAAMAPFLTAEFGNPSSIHAEGVTTAKAVSEARKKIGKILGVQADEIIFTSGGTEANNLAILGSAGPIVTTNVEHKSVLEAARAAGRRGRGVTFLPVDETGLVQPSDLALTLEQQPDTTLVSIIYVHNEFGTVQPVKALAKVIREFKRRTGRPASAPPYLHLDACQAARFFDCSLERLGADLLTLNGGKMYGPKGVGCLVVRRGIEIAPRQYGGGQERGRRSGTENVAGIVGLAQALQFCAEEREAETAKLTLARDELITGLLALPETRLNGHPTLRSPNNVNISFGTLDAEQLVIELDTRGIAASAGSACATGTGDDSYAILALGGTPERARSAVRFSLDRGTSRRQLAKVVEACAEIIKKLTSSF